MKHIKLIIAAMTALTVASCSNNKFKVEGEIANAADSVLYFENVGLEGINTLDSVKLSDGGSFSFSQEAPEAPAPEAPEKPKKGKKGKAADEQPAEEAPAE